MSHDQVIQFAQLVTESMGALWNNPNNLPFVFEIHFF